MNQYYTYLCDPSVTSGSPHSQEGNLDTEAGPDIAELEGEHFMVRLSFGDNNGDTLVLFRILSSGLHMRFLLGVVAS